MNDAKLLPCPFCGSAVISRSKDGEYHVIQCAQCGCEMANTIRYKLDSAWNRRTPHPSPVTVREAEPVAWTGSGSLMALAYGHEGFMWPAKADAHPIPLYDHPPQPSETVADTDAIAKAIAFSGEIKERRGWDDLLPETRKLYRDKATAALRALKGGIDG